MKSVTYTQVGTLGNVTLFVRIQLGLINKHLKYSDMSAVNVGNNRHKACAVRKQVLLPIERVSG